MPLKNTREVPAGPVPPVRGPAGAVPTGPAVIAQYLKTLPNAPGVYRMIDAEGTVQWSHVSPLAVNPGADGILEALESIIADAPTPYGAIG